MKIKIISNPTKNWAISLGDALKKEFENFLGEKEDLTIVIGGDGTLLYNKNKVNGIAILIGSSSSRRAHIKAGKNFEVEAIVKKLKEMMKNPSYVALPFLEAKTQKSVYYGINDIVISSNNHRIVKTKITNIYFNEEDEGDGIIISTPFGSLGYNKSVGGSEISLPSKVLSLSFISSIHKKIPIIFPPVKTSLKVIEGNADLVVDGELEEKNIKDVSISLSSKYIKYYYKPLLI